MKLQKADDEYFTIHILINCTDTFLRLIHYLKYIYIYICSYFIIFYLLKELCYLTSDIVQYLIQVPIRIQFKNMYNHSKGKLTASDNRTNNIQRNSGSSSIQKGSSQKTIPAANTRTTMIKKQPITNKEKTNKDINLPPVAKKQPISSASSNTKTNKTFQSNPPYATATTTVSKRKIQGPFKPRREVVKQCQWINLPCSFLISICQYCCVTLFDVYKLSRVNSIWRAHMCSEQGMFFWNHLKGAEEIETFGQMLAFLRKSVGEQQQKMSFEFQKIFTKLFNYGSTKQNIPNKLIKRLDLELQVRLNNRTAVSQPYKLRTFNFSSYLCAKIQQIQDFKYDFYTPHNMFKDNITIDMIFKSKKYKVTHKISKKYCPEEIVETAIKQKAYNYFLDKNFVFTFFEGDNHFLYIFFEISLLELVNTFRWIIKNNHEESLQKKMKKVPMYKKLCETQFQDFVEEIKYQADFQVHFSYHNSLKQIFTHCDTKAFPLNYDKKHAYFELKVDDSFEKQATYKLDNKMGMSESVQGLYLLDFVLKSRDKFLIIFSGFIYARPATDKQRQSLDNYFQYADRPIIIIESKQQKYFIQFLIIEEGHRNLLKNVKLTLFP